MPHVWWNIRKLRSTKPETRARAAEKLGTTGSARAVLPLCGVLRDEQQVIRTAAAKALGELKKPQAVGDLVTALLSEKHWDVRYEIVDALRKIGDPTAVNELLVILDNRDTDVGLQQVTTWALKEFGWDHLTDAQKAMVLIRREEWSNLPRLGVAAIVPLRTAIRQGTHRMRMDACEALAQVADEGAVKTLFEFLSDDDDNLRRTAAAGLEKRAWTRMNPEQSATVMVALEKWTAVPSFGESALAPLRRVLKQTPAPTKCRALDALAQIGSTDAVQLIASVLADEDAHVRRTATRLLGHFPSEESINHLRGVLNDGDRGVRKAAALSLSEIGYQPVDPADRIGLALAAERTASILELGPSAVAPLIANLAQPTLRSLAVETLVQIGSTALPKAIEALEDESPTMRLSAAELLGALNASGAHAALEKALRDPEMAVRLAAHEALLKSGWKPRNEVHAATVAVAIERWDEVEALGPAAMPALIALIEHKGYAAQGFRLIERALIGERSSQIAPEHLEALANLANNQSSGLTRGATGDLKATVARRRVAQIARQQLQRRGSTV